MPVLHAFRDVDHSAGDHLYGLPAPFLIIAPAADADQHLAAAALRVVDMPVVAASGLKGHVEDRNLLGGERRQITLSHEELTVGVGIPDREEDGVLVSVPVGQGRLLLIPDLLGQTKYRPALGPAHIHGRVGDDRGDLLLRHAVRFGILQVIGQGGIRDPGGHQGNDGNDALCLYIDRLLVPNLPKEHIIIEMREHGGKFSQLVSPGGLYNLFSHFMFPPLALQSSGYYPQPLNPGCFCMAFHAKASSHQGY